MHSIFDITDLLIKKGLPFAFYSLPGSSKCKLVIQKDKICKHVEITDIKDVAGFVIAEFNSARTGLANLILPDIILSEGDNIEEVVKFLDNLPAKGGFCFSENICISESEYIDRLTYLIDKLKNGDLQKVVLSRVLKKELHENLNAGKLLKMLSDKYEDAFVYLFHLPEKGTWCGATPETLVKVIDDNVYIDALAGTRLISNKEPEPKWSIKEKEEQYYVTLFIESLLSELGINNYEESDPITITAGKLAHICTKFNIPFKDVTTKIGKLLAGLHPTPAVCGLPKAEAFLLINKAEQHERRFYTGFIGPWNLDSDGEDKNLESQLYVNLRCAELGSNEINIYVGGGLTEHSNPEAEYQETVHKSQTLLSIVENL